MFELIFIFFLGPLNVPHMSIENTDNLPRYEIIFKGYIFKTDSGCRVSGNTAFWSVRVQHEMIHLMETDSIQGWEKDCRKI